MANANNLTINLAVLGFPAYASQLQSAQNLAISTTVNINNSFNQTTQSANSLQGALKSLSFGAAGALAVKFLKDTTEAAFDAERANRKLSASATEAGLAYGVLADKNREFAKAAGLSETAATNVTAKIAQLATFGGRPQDIDKLQKSFLDLSAAKGIQSKDIDTLIGTILSGQDEGLNRLGISDPGQLYKAYAKEIGTSADALSQFQKVQAATNAVMEKAAIFSGANADKMQSLSGQAEQANASLENLYTNFGQGLTQSVEFRNFLSFANEALGSFTTNLQNVKKELADGTSPKNAAIKEGNKAGNQILDAVGDFLSPVGAAIGFGVDAVNNVSTKEATDNFVASIGGTHKRRIAALTNAFTAEKKLIEQQKADAATQKDQLGNKTFASSFQSKLDSLLKGSSDGVSKLKIQAKDIDAARKELNANLAKLGDTDFEKANSKLDSLTRKFYSERAQDAEKRFSRNPNLADASFNLTALNSIKSKLPQELFESFSDKLTDFVKTETAKLTDLATDLQGALTAGFEKENPFIKNLVLIETATERAQKKFGVFGDSVVSKIADIERADLNKAIGLQNFENQFEALKLRQQGERLAATPENQFADFKRALDRVEQKADSFVRISSLTRDINEASFYSDKYNPNNPKSFAEFNRRDFNDDISDTGINVRNAVSDILGLKGMSDEGTGALGRGAIADKILGLIPKREDLLGRLNNPNLAGDAQFLLEQQTGALQTKRDAEQTKLRDFLAEQKFQEFGKQFAYEQIGLINNDSALTNIEKAKRRLSVTDALGNDLDPRLKSQAIQDSAAAANEKNAQIKEGMQIARDTKALVSGILTAVLGGVKFDASTVAALQNSLQVTIKDESNGAASFSLPSKATTADTQREYNDALNDPSYRIGDSHKAGSLFGSKLR